MDRVKLFVNGRIYEGWKSIAIRKRLTAISNSFSLSVTDRFNGQKNPWPIQPGDECELFSNENPILTGYVFKAQPTLSAQEMGISVSGRDKTSDLIDCSWDGQNEFKNQTLDKLFSALAKPFGIKVINRTDASEEFKVWRIQPSETVFSSMERAARLRGVLLISDGLGNLIITRKGSGQTSTNLVQGENILSINTQFDHTQRFSEYIVKCQSQGFEDTSPSLTTKIESRVRDDLVGRFRPKVIIAEAQADQVIAQKRAQWELNIRAAQSSPIKVSVQGWRQADGSLWDFNQLVDLKAPFFNIDSQFLISGVDYRKGSQGTTTSLELMRPDAFELKPTVEKQAVGFSRGF